MSKDSCQHWGAAIGQIITAAWMLALVGTAWAAAPAMTGAAAVPAGAASSQGQQAASTVLDDKIRSDLVAATVRLNSLEGTIAKSTERADRLSDRSAINALLIVIVSVSASLLGQWLLIRHQRTLNREQVQAEVANSYVEWQLKQLSELYGPLRALLGQSNAMYRQMNRALAAAVPDIFRLEKRQGADFDNEIFEIRKDGEWTRFRTVKHIGEVYNRGYGVEPYFDDVVETGARMAELIREKAGYARADDKDDDEDLMDVMGKYLAHYAVLTRLHKQVQSGYERKANTADEHATFPIKMQKLVDEGFNAINREVMEWRHNRPEAA